jgi:outer membrane immunogenic protein
MTSNMGHETAAFLTLALLGAPQLAFAEGAFNGFYGGAGAGYGFDGTSIIPDGGSIYDFDIKGGQVSLLGGYNFQAGRFVFGIEGDANFGKIKGTQTVTDGPFRYDGAAASQTYYTLRARIGFTPTDNLLLFATAGPAYGKLATSTILTAPTVLGPLSPFTVTHEEKSVDGYVLGLGGEYNLSENTALRLEYSELYFNGVKFTQKNPGGPSASFSTDNAASFVRSAIAFGF